MKKSSPSKTREENLGLGSLLGFFLFFFLSGGETGEKPLRLLTAKDRCGARAILIPGSRARADPCWPAPEVLPPSFLWWVPPL